MNRWSAQAKKLRLIFSPPHFQAAVTDLLNQATLIKTLDERTLWFEHVLLWLLKDVKSGDRYVRVRFLIKLLNQRPEWRQAFVRQIVELAEESPMLRFFLQTGYSAELGLIHEIAHRMLRRVMPTVRENSLLEITDHVFRKSSDVEWLEELPDSLAADFVQIFDVAARTRLLAIFKANAREAMVVFAAQLLNLGLTHEIRVRSGIRTPSESALVATHTLLMKCVSHDTIALEDRKQVHRLIGECQSILQSVYGDMEIRGTSVGLVYRLEVITATLDRIKLLLHFFDESASGGHERIKLLFAEQVHSAHASRSIVGHVRQHLHLISRKIAERNGNSGEHYIARSKQERRDLFVSALWGGLIVLMMTLVKLGLHELGFPPLLQAIFVWLVYTTGFLTMQFTHATLATKLPSFTASKLARLMNEIRSSADVDVFILEVKTVLKSQALAFAGNILSLIPLAWGLSLLVQASFGHPILHHEYAAENLAALNPIASLAIFLGALTGVLLWLSSLAGGWFENWIVYQKVPIAISDHRRLQQIFGKPAAHHFGEWIRKHASGISANVSLGFLFGFVPFLGTILGIPLDSKHVTISSATAALAFLSLPELPNAVSVFALTAIGLVLIGIMNLAVSFALALVVAARASAVRPARFRVLIRMVGKRLITFKKAQIKS